MDFSINRISYINKISGFIDKEVVKILTGIRRCGKSEMLKLLKEEVLKLTDEAHIIYINFEDIKFDFIKNYKDLHNYVLDKVNDEQKYYLFFDEIQVVEDWEKAINSFRLRKTDIYITGSNSKLLSGEFATLLSGRYVQFEIKPLTFKEFLNFRNINKITPMYSDMSTEKVFINADSTISDRHYFIDYFLLGGFPFISTKSFNIEQTIQIIKDIHSSIVLKDVVLRNRIKNVMLLEKIIAYFYDNVGNLISLRNISEYISGGEKKKASINLETIGNYVSHLESAYIIKKVPRYDIKGKKLFETNDKFYLADHSLIYVIKDFSKANKGGILENIVHNELSARGYNIYVGRLGSKEIDFVAERNGERLYIQVCLEFTLNETYERELAPLKDINDNYPKYIISLDSYAGRDERGINIISIKDFLLKEEY